MLSPARAAVARTGSAPHGAAPAPAAWSRASVRLDAAVTAVRFPTSSPRGPGHALAAAAPRSAWPTTGSRCATAAAPRCGPHPGAGPIDMRAGPSPRSTRRSPSRRARVSSTRCARICWACRSSSTPRHDDAGPEIEATMQRALAASPANRVWRCWRRSTRSTSRLSWRGAANRCRCSAKSQQLFDGRPPPTAPPRPGATTMPGCGRGAPRCVWGMPRRRATATSRRRDHTRSAWVRTQLLPEAEGALADTTNSKRAGHGDPRRFEHSGAPRRHRGPRASRPVADADRVRRGAARLPGRGGRRHGAERVIVDAAGKPLEFATFGGRARTGAVSDEQGSFGSSCRRALRDRVLPDRLPGRQASRRAGTDASRSGSASPTRPCPVSEVSSPRRRSTRGRSEGRSCDASTS